MLGKKMSSVKILAKKVKVMGRIDGEPSLNECLLRDCKEGSPSDTTPTSSLAIYVGEERQRFVVPTGVSTFQEVVTAVERCNGKFDFGELVEEFI
ncbi:hypothetical protein F0562_017066 [Nyssa sinensis]|uniref:Auxin-responsive protein n=1 Tax=Nyssa sinensis TaxID=561372 RepID=A0A5J4ZG89_9ASTE|nr:hypothetical protein F0562_017066 [Nyssa sinensis]